MEKPLKLFVWHGVLTDYTDGVMFALAPDVESAREAIMRAAGAKKAKKPEDHVSAWERDLRGEPEVVTGTAGFFVCGGG